MRLGKWRVEGLPERREHAVVEFRVTGKDWKNAEVRRRVVALTDALGMNPIHLGEKDTYKLSYNFAIEYRNVVAQLRALIALLAIEDVWADVSLWEASGGSLLIVELIDALRATERAIEARA